MFARVDMCCNDGTRRIFWLKLQVFETWRINHVQTYSRDGLTYHFDELGQPYEYRLVKHTSVKSKDIMELWFNGCWYTVPYQDSKVAITALPGYKNVIHRL